MEEKHGDIIQTAGVSDLHSLKTRLRSMAPAQILSELTERTEQAQLAGRELDANIVLVYYDVLDEVDPIEVPAGACQQSLSRFAHEHPEHISPVILETSPARPPKRSHKLAQYFKLHPVAAIIAVVILLSSGTVAFALDLPQRIILWGQETFQIRPAGGDMQVENPAEGEYASLEDALAAYDIQAYTPTWVPEGVKLKEVAVSENDLWTAFVAIYISKDAGQEIGIVKLIKYNDLADMPYLEFEDNGVDSRTSIMVGDLSVSITTNNSSIRASWSEGHCLGNVFGEFTETEVKQIAQSLKLKGS